MATEAEVRNVLRTVNDPEMPISIVDLGMVAGVRLEENSSRVCIDLLPTFVGCPALGLIQEEVVNRLRTLPGVHQVEVCFRYDPPWSVDRISESGREALRQIGVTVPEPLGSGEPNEPRCPFCGSDNVQRESPFGPTRCRMIYHCDACRNSFEHMKRLV
jgi:ring-1,2-phenylacetyl-CoA epoxidase subunit PaaD